jgi:hypothetical protein
MPVTARISPRYLGWLGLIALFCLGFALWFLYDGAIAYPRQRERGLAFEKLEKENRLDEWRQVAKERGWPPDLPEKPKTEAEIYSQLVLAGVVALPGLLCGFFLLRAWGRWIELDETGLRTSWGRQLEFGQISTLDKKKWKSKGIARIAYQQNGRKRRLVLDDWKYDAPSTAAILREVESRLDLSQIVGGPPEPPAEVHAEPEAEPEEEAPAADEEA